MTGALGMEAQEVSEMLLERTAQAILTGDFEGFSHCFAVPHTIDTPDQKATLNNRAELHDLFNRLVRSYGNLNVTSMIRYCEVAEFRGPNRVDATHVSHVMSGNQRVVAPHHGFSVIEFIDGRWRLTSTQYTLGRQLPVGAALHAIVINRSDFAPLPATHETSKKESSS